MYLDVNVSSVLEGKSPQFSQQLISGITALDAHCYRDKHLDINEEILLLFLLTLTVALHATGSVDSVTKQTVAWHLHPHNAGTHRP